MVVSKLCFGIDLYGNATKGLIDKIQIMQNKILKIILKKPKRYSTNVLHKEANILLINDLIHFRGCILIFDFKMS